MKKLRWGVLSTAKIGLEKVIPATMRSPHSSVVAIASRDAARAKAAAAKLDIPRAYGSYEELLSDAEVDAIYNPLPNHLHVPWSIKALEAGKHVLVEKPIGLSAAEGEKLVEAARGFPTLKVMEAFMYRHHPQWQTARRLVDVVIREERLDRAQLADAPFVDPANIRNQADIGGGSLADIGCYCISLSRFLFAAEPVRVCGIVEFDAAFKTDRLVSGILDFGRGTSIFTCATQLAPFQRVNILGTEGRVEIDIPFNAPPDRPCTMRHQTREGTREIALETCDQYTVQAELFALAVLEDRPVPTPLEDAVANMRVIEAVLASSRAGTWTT